MAGWPSSGTLAHMLGVSLSAPQAGFCPPKPQVLVCPIALVITYY